MSMVGSSSFDFPTSGNLASRGAVMPKWSAADRERWGGWLFLVLIPLWMLGLIFPAMIAAENRQVLQVISLAWPVPFFLHFGGSYFLYGGSQRGSIHLRIFTALFVCAYCISS